MGIESFKTDLFLGPELECAGGSMQLMHVIYMGVGVRVMMCCLRRARLCRLWIMHVSFLSFELC
jgi:hypothetical protein